MGRTHSALAEHTARDLAQWLLSLRRVPGLSISQVASRTEQVGMPTSRSTLYRAELLPVPGQRPSVPAWPVVEAYAKACDGSITEARRLWTKAAAAPAPGKNGSVPRRPAMAPQYISEPADLLLAMRDLRLRAGNPSLRELENRATAHPGAVTVLPRSTLGAVLNGTRRCRRDFLADFVRACGVTRESEVMRWVGAWDRIEASYNDTADHDMHHRLTVLEEDLHHTKAVLAAVLPKPRPSDTGRPHTTEPDPGPVTAPGAGTPVHAGPTRTRRPRQWLSGLVRSIAAAAF